MHMALFRVRDGLIISAQVSEIFHEPLGIFSRDFRCFVHF